MLFITCTLAALNLRKEISWQLERLEVRDEKNGRTVVILTNHMSFGSAKIAVVDKKRCQGEIFLRPLDRI